MGLKNTRDCRVSEFIWFSYFSLCVSSLGEAKR